MVQMAYDVWGMDLVILIECENWQRNPFARGDGWDAIWLCQMNTNYYKLPQAYYDDRWYQIQYCNEKRLAGTPFYWPSRILKSWNRCYAEVSKRFTFTNEKW